MNKRHVLTAAVLAVGGIGLAAAPTWAQAQQDQPSAQPGTASQDHSAHRQDSAVGQPVGRDDAAQIAGDRSSLTGAAAQASTSDVRQVLSQTANAILSQGGIQSLRDQLSRNDQDRLGDLTQQGQQIEQSAQQVRQAFKDKYQQDLDLRASADRVFSATFFQIGGSAADRAQPASGTLAPDSGATGTGAGTSGAGASGAGTSGLGTSGAGTSGTSTPGATGASPSGAETSGAGTSGLGATGPDTSTAGTSGAGTSGTSASSAGTSGAGTSGVGTSPGTSGTDATAGAGTSGTGTSAAGTSGGLSSDLAQTAGSTSMQQTAVTIPASHGMPQARVMLVQEGGQWKIDLPDSMDAQRFSQQLQRHLQQAAQSKDQWPQDATEAQRAIAHHVLMAFSDPSAAGAGARGAGAGSGARDSGTGASGTSGTGTGATGTGATGTDSGTGATGAGTGGTSR